MEKKVWWSDEKVKEFMNIPLLDLKAQYESIREEVLSLPIYPELTKQQIEEIVKAIKTLIHIEFNPQEGSRRL